MFSDWSDQGRCFSSSGEWCLSEHLSVVSEGMGFSETICSVSNVQWLVWSGQMLKFILSSSWPGLWSWLHRALQHWCPWLKFYLSWVLVWEVLCGLGISSWCLMVPSFTLSCCFIILLLCFVYAVIIMLTGVIETTNNWAVKVTGCYLPFLYI